MADPNVDFSLGIPFTTYLLYPDVSERTWFTIAVPNGVVDAARRFVDAGGWYECRVLRGGVTVSAHVYVDGEDREVARKVTKNGPPLVDAVAAMVRESASTVDGRTG